MGPDSLFLLSLFFIAFKVVICSNVGFDVDDDEGNSDMTDAMTEYAYYLEYPQDSSVISEADLETIRQSLPQSLSHLQSHDLITREYHIQTNEGILEDSSEQDLRANSENGGSDGIGLEFEVGIEVENEVPREIEANDFSCWIC